MVQALDVVYCNLSLYLLGLWHVFENIVENVSHRSRILTDNIDLSGKIAIITGCNRGLGKAICFELVRRNCNVILACRDRIAAQRVVEEASNLTPLYESLGSCEVVDVDLSRLASVKACAQTLKCLLKSQCVDFMICNAGIMAPEHLYMTHDGYELQFQVNFLSHMYLVHQVLTESVIAHDGRIVFVSSFAHCGASGDLLECFECLNGYSAKLQYSNTKLFDILIAQEFQRRILQGGYGDDYTRVTCLSVNPGVVNTQLARDFCINEFPGYMNRIITAVFGVLFSFTLRKPENAALLILQALQHEDRSSYVSCGPFGSWTPPHMRKWRIPEEMSRNLWEASFDALDRGGWL